MRILTTLFSLFIALIIVVIYLIGATQTNTVGFHTGSSDSPIPSKRKQEPEIDQDTDDLKHVPLRVKLAYTNFTTYSKVDDSLYIGSKFISMDKLKRLKITNIVRLLPPDLDINDTDKLPSAGWKGTSIIIRLNDSVVSDIMPAIYMAVPYIDNVIKSGGRVYVHCEAGISRSATIVIAYLMAKHKWTYEQAFVHLKKKRPVILPNLGFESQLRTNETDIHLLIR